MDATTKRRPLERLLKEAKTPAEKSAACRALMIYDARHGNAGARFVCHAKGVIWWKQ